MSAKNFTKLDDPELIALIKSGAVGVLPTDTIYGLVALASNPQSATSVLKVKGRQYKPGTLIAANADQLVALGVKARYLKPIQAVWPGPVSVVIPIGWKNSSICITVWALYPCAFLIILRF